MRNLFVLLIGLSFISLTLSENDNRRSEDLVYVDFLTTNYLRTELDIWKDIASNANLKDVIRKIHSEHLALFSNQFLTTKQIHDQLLLNEKNFFDVTIDDVNLNIRLVKENYLHDSADPESLKKEILEMAMNNSNTTLLDIIYDSVVKEDLFVYIKTVISNK